VAGAAQPFADTAPSSIREAGPRKTKRKSAKTTSRKPVAGKELKEAEIKVIERSKNNSE